MPSSEFLLGRSLAAFDEAGQLVYAEKVKELAECFDEFLLFAEDYQSIKSGSFLPKSTEQTIFLGKSGQRRQPIMKFIGIVGTNAKHSYNRMLLQFMQTHFAKQAEIEILELTDVPMFNESEDQSNSPVIQLFNDKIMAADGVIIATPEHNHSIPSALKSIIEWLSFNLHPFDGKPVMIVGASYDVQGSSRAQLHLRQVLDAPGVNATVMPGSEFLLGRAQEAFDAEGNLKVEGTIDFLDSCFWRFMRFAKVANQLNEPEEVTFEPGEFTVVTPGHNGDLPMVVTLSEDRIENIDIDTSNQQGLQISSSLTFATNHRRQTQTWIFFPSIGDQ